MGGRVQIAARREVERVVEVQRLSEMFGRPVNENEPDLSLDFFDQRGAKSARDAATKDCTVSAQPLPL